LIRLAVAAVAAVLLAACATDDSDQVAQLRSELQEQEAEIAALTAENERLKDSLQAVSAPQGFATEEPTAEPTEEPASTASATIDDGIWQVGTDIRPGTYRAPGGGGCYWARLRSANPNSIIVNGFAGENQTVELAAEGEWFETDDCGTWTRL
jgi:outer membrane murein-binding lipoprotein Lpp